MNECTGISLTLVFSRLNILLIYLDGMRDATIAYSHAFCKEREQVP